MLPSEARVPGPGIEPFVSERTAELRLAELRVMLAEADGAVEARFRWGAHVGGAEGPQLIDYIRARLEPSDFERVVFVGYQPYYHPNDLGAMPERAVPFWLRRWEAADFESAEEELSGA